MSDAHRQGIVSAKEAQFFTRRTRKGSADVVSEGVFPRRCNEFLICPQEKSKWKIGYPRLVFVVLYYMSHEPGFIWATSCLLLFFRLLPRWSREFIISCGASVCHFLTSHQNRQGSCVCSLASVCQQMLHPSALPCSLCFSHHSLLYLQCTLLFCLEKGREAHFSLGFLDYTGPGLEMERISNYLEVPPKEQDVVNNALLWSDFCLFFFLAVAPVVSIEGNDKNWHVGQQNVKFVCGAKASPPAHLFTWIRSVLTEPSPWEETRRPDLDTAAAGNTTF